MNNETLVIVPPEQFRTSSSEMVIGSTSISTMPSPYDIPEAFLSYENERDGTYIVDLKYVGADEPCELINIGNDLKVKTGKNSRRLYGFIVDSHAGLFNQRTALASLQGAIQAVMTDPSFTRRSNYDLVSQALTSVGEKVVESLPKAAA